MLPCLCICVNGYNKRIQTKQTKSVIPSPAIKCTFSVLRAYWQIRGLNLNKDDYLLLPKDQRQTTCFLLALASCLTWLLERSPPVIDICILVEKRTYLHCIEIYESRDKYAQEIWKLLNELAQEHQVFCRIWYLPKTQSETLRGDRTWETSQPWGRTRGRFRPCLTETV